MNKIWIGTNWKMTKTIGEGIEYTNKLIQISNTLIQNIELFIIPSHTSLVPIKELAVNSSVHVGSQNMHWKESGAYTGEISPRMLNEIGIDLVELGHSERRLYFNENDQNINKKVLTALDFGMKPLICIGENLEQKNSHISKEILTIQLKIALKNVPKEQINNILIAYEPVWAIGEQGLPANPDYVAEIHNLLRDTLNEIYKDGGRIPLLYGGSVNKENCLDYLKNREVNGLFIGRAAWEIDSFQEILLKINNEYVNKK